MSTHARTTANRQNATRSTGPRTPEGKAISSQNATRHALTGNFRLLPGENPTEFDRLQSEYRRQFQPASDHELFLLTQLTQARWKIDRIHRLQSEALEQALAAGDPALSPDARLVAALSLPNSAYDRLERYLAHAERTFFRAHRELTLLTRRRAEDFLASCNAQVDRLIAEPLPVDPPPLQNEPNPARQARAEHLRRLHDPDLSLTDLAKLPSPPRRRL